MYLKAKATTGMLRPVSAYYDVDAHGCYNEGQCGCNYVETYTLIGISSTIVRAPRQDSRLAIEGNTQCQRQISGCG